jgi:hypothetical protein
MSKSTMFSKLTNLIICLLLCSCSSLAVKPIVYDDAFFKEHIKDINILLVRTDFPQINGLLARQGLNSKEYYDKIAQRLQEDFVHNGLKTVAVTDFNESSRVPSLTNIYRPEFNSTNTLVIYPEKIGVRNGIEAINYTMHLKLISSGKVVWETIDVIGTNQVFDYLSLDILGQLVKLNLFTPTHTPIETANGKSRNLWR